MAILRRVPVVWTGQTGLPGLSVFYSLQADDATAALGTFFNSIKGSFVSPLSWAVPSSGDSIESTTGTLTGAWTGGTAATVGASGGGVYPAGTGGIIRWLTGMVRNGRKFQGRTYLTGISGSQYDTDGTILAASVTQWNTAAATLAGSGLLQLWGRPTTPGGSDGIVHPILAGVAVDKVTSLRTRRN
jgi:hypothetical protein